MKIFRLDLLTVTVSIEILLILNLCSALKKRINSTRFYCYYTNDQCPSEDIQFWLYTKETTENPTLLDPLNLTPDLFPERLSLKILVHGLGLNRDTSPNQELRPLFLQHEQTYVISVDYSAISRVLCYYPWAVNNAPVVSKCLASLLNNLIEMGVYTAKDIHIIGFSLGGQIAGLTANHMNDRVGRITALDPAGPFYDTNNLTERLDPSDAEFVDVIHTDPRIFSTSTALGHVDFYPNYMHIVQPGCNPITEFNLCNHFRANTYYAESIITEIGFWSYNCGNYEEFLHNQCANYSDLPQVQMGYFVDKNARGAYFLETNSKPPYAQGPLVQFEFSVGDKMHPET